MKKILYAVLISAYAYVSFADVKKEVENFVKKDVNSKEFKQADKLINSLQEQGSELSRQGKYEEAMQCYQKALAQADKLYGKESTASAMLYTSMATLYIRKKNGIKAAEYLVKASNTYNNSMGGMLIVKNYYVLRLQAARIYCDLEKTDTAYPILKGLENEIKMVPPERKAELYYLLASCIFDQKKYIQAIKYCKMADKNLSPDSRKTFLRAKIYDVWANSLVHLGKRKEALAIKKKCIEFAKKDGRYASFIGQAMFYTGINYMELDNYSEAKKYLMEALVIFRKLDKSGIAWQGSAYLFLAHNARYHNKWKEAETYYEKATVLFEKILFNKNVKNKFSKKSMDMAFIGICKAYKWLPQCYFHTRTLEKIDILYPKLVKLQKIETKSILLLDIFSSWAPFYIELDDYAKALVLVDKGLKTLKSLPPSNYNKKKKGFLLWSKAKALHLTGKSQTAYKNGLIAFSILKNYYSNNPQTLAMLENMLESMKKGMPFKK